MPAPLRLAIPLPAAHPSSWRSSQGFWFCLHTRSPGPSCLLTTLTVTRHTIHAPVVLRLRLSVPASATKPVQNVHASAFPDRHPHVAVVSLPAETMTTSVQFHPLSPPGRTRTLVVHLDVDVEPLPPGSPIDVRRMQLPGSASVAVPLPPPTRSSVPDGVGATALVRRVLWLTAPLPAERRTPNGVGYISDEIATDTFDAHEGLSDAQEEEEGTSLGYNLSSLLHHNFSDVELVAGATPNSKVFNLHRCVLALASPVFRAMLSSDMLERETGRIELPTFSMEGVAAVVRHIYGGELGSLKPDLSFELYRFAHQYEVASLLKLSRRTLLSSVSQETAVPVLCFAMLYDDIDLRERSHQFIAHHFSGMVGATRTLDMVCSLSAAAMYALLESDSLRATELEVLLVSLRWLARQHSSSHRDGVLRRIRWGLMTADMLDVVQSAGITTFSPKIAYLIYESRACLMDEEVTPIPGSISRRRFFGRPTASVWLPLLQSPPPILSPGKDRKRVRRQSPAAELHIETRFERFGLRWSFRAQAIRCEGTACRCAGVSASLWLEEGEDGKVWRRGGEGGDVFPLRVVARCLVWNGKGGQVRSKAFKVVFRSAGWACGWSVQDLLDGHEEVIASEMEKGAGMSTPDALQVAVEICECTSLT